MNAANALSQEQMDMIYKSCSLDESVLIDLYKVLAEISGTAGQSQLLPYFVDKIIVQQ